MISAKAQLASNCTAKVCIQNVMSSCLYICHRLYLWSQKCIRKFIIPASNQFNSRKVHIQESNKIISVSQDSGLFRGVTRCFLKSFSRYPPSVTPNISNARIMASGEGLVCRISESSRVGVGYVLIRKFLSYMKGIGTEEGKGKAGTPFLVIQRVADRDGAFRGFHQRRHHPRRC